MDLIRIVMVEDSADDAALCRRALEKGGLAIDFRHVNSRQALRDALSGPPPDLVLSDFFLPHFDGLRAIGEVRSRAPGTPVIIVTGALDEETAADCIRAGAADYVMKDHLVRLPVAVRAALARRQEELATRALREASERQLRRLVAMNAVDEAIAGSHDLRATLAVLFDHLLAELAVDGACVLLADPGGRTLTMVAEQGILSGPDPGFTIGFGQSVSGHAAQERRVILAGQFHDMPIPDHRLARGREFIASAPLMVRGEVVGALTVVRTQASRPDQEWIQYFRALADQCAVAVANATLVGDLQRANDELTRAYDATIEGWVRALDLRDHETEGHTQRVTAMTLRLARAVGMSEDQLVHVRRGALLHDIGKMAVPDSILRKPGPLTPEERAIMEQHPTTAWNMLSGIAYLEPALDIPWCHHERWDGKGYPRRLAGEAIPLAARIFSLVDVWDALRSHRVYRAAWPEDEVRRHLRDGAGTQFDPALTHEFMTLLAEADVEPAAGADLSLPRSISSARGWRARRDGTIR